MHFSFVLIIIIIVINLYCRHTVHIHIKNFYKTYISTVIIKCHKIKIVQINITLISIIVEWESEYKQWESCMPL